MRRVLVTIRRRGYLVVDEATDQTFPASLAALSGTKDSDPVLRIRNFAKGLGLNGLRLAAVIHSPKLRPLAVDCLESLGGSLDVHSLMVMATLAERGSQSQLRTMLEAANNQVTALRADAQRLTRGTVMTVHTLVNGYIGSATIDLKTLGNSDAVRRRRLLEGCRRHRTPVILGASFYMASDSPRESVRINFFSHREEVVRGVQNILAAANGS